jgi:hypothetical protein
MNINNLKQYRKPGEPLAECPVCGSPAREGYNMQGSVIYCGAANCQMSLGPSYHSLSRADLAKLWNSIERVKNAKCETTTNTR